MSDWPDTPPQKLRRRSPPPQGAPGPQQASATVGEGKSEIRRVTMHCRRPPVIGWTPNRPCMSNVTTSSGYPNAQKKMGHAFPTLGACQSPWCRWGGWRLPGGYRGRTARIQANQSPGVWKHLERDRERERERERDRRRLRWLAGSGAVVVAGNVPVRARISTHFRKVTYCEKLTFLVQIYFYTFISLHIPLKWKLPSPRFEQDTAADHKWHEIGPSENLRIELVGGELLLQRCAGMAPATTWATRPGTKTRPLPRHDPMGHPWHGSEPRRPREALHHTSVTA